MSSAGGAIEVQLHNTLAGINPGHWDHCACPEAADGRGRARDPFTTYRFLNALEESGSVGGASGWHPCYLTAHLSGAMIACAPLYLKTHSQGEYVFDFAWAEAYERAGGRYYPKLQMSVPFTPVAGRRWLVAPGHEVEGRAALMQGALELAQQQGCSSLHITFCTAQEAETGKAMGLHHRLGQQFHWRNEGYEDFAAFLDTLASRKRKAIRKERAVAEGFGGEITTLTGSALRPEHWDSFWQFYQDTGARKWGQPYLTRAFFDHIQRDMRDDVALVLAHREGRAVAGALNFIGRDTLFGRYWGACEHHPCLHFELCYYRAQEFAIGRGLGWVEAGAQGEHKLARGYLPRATHSLHWIADEGFSRAVGQFVRAEREAVGEDMDILTDFGPFRKGR